MHIFLYGPPGVGKSTVIRCLREMGHSALDLEEVAAEERTFTRAAVADETFIAMADVPVRKRGQDLTVLLSMDQRDYERRRYIRDELEHGKRGQKRHLISVWEELTNWDAIVHVPFDQDPYSTAARLQILYRQAMRTARKDAEHG